MFDEKKKPACLHAGENDLVNKKVWNPDGSLVMAQQLGRENVLMQGKRIDGVMPLGWAGEAVSMGAALGDSIRGYRCWQMPP